MWPIRVVPCLGKMARTSSSILTQSQDVGSSKEGCDPGQGGYLQLRRLPPDPTPYLGFWGVCLQVSHVLSSVQTPADFDLRNLPA